MAKRQKAWARKVRDQLIDQLGGQCVHCGATERLEFDHINGRDWPAAQTEWSHRMSIVRREASEGQIQLLCRRCNARKGEPAPPAPSLFDPPPELCPF